MLFNIMDHLVFIRQFNLLIRHPLKNIHRHIFLYRIPNAVIGNGFIMFKNTNITNNKYLSSANDSAYHYIC